MKLDAAKSTALNMSNRFGIDVVVYRMPGFVAGEWAVLGTDQVPPGAEIAETYRYTTATAAPTASAPAKPRGPEQGGLF